MRPSQPRVLLAVALVTTLLVNLMVRLGYGSLPAFPWPAGVPLAVLGLAEAVGGTVLRAGIRGTRGARPVQPLVAARAVLLAKASALAGALMTGAWAGLLAHVLPRAGELTAAAGDAVAAAVGVACSLGLVAGALWLERCCRTPEDGDHGGAPPGDRP